MNEAMRIIDTKSDFLDCVCVETATIKPKLIEKAIDAQAKAMKEGHYRFVGIPNHEKLSEVDLIMKFFKLKELDYDIVVLGTKGNEFTEHESAKYLGSVVSALLKHIPSNVLLVP
jgi:nucleotide-binding universal stress UspA family protein